MSLVSNDPRERARKMESFILRRLQEPGRQVALSTAIGVSESTISRLKNEQLNNFCLVLAHLGMQVIPEDVLAVDEHLAASMLSLAQQGWSQIRTVQDLRWKGE